MVKYIKQHNSYSCGPIAIANVFRWLQLKYPSVDQISQVVKCKSPNGTLPNHFHFGLTRLIKQFATVECFWHNSVLDIKKHIRKGGCVVINFEVEKHQSRHYALIVGLSKSEKSFHVVNILPSSSGSPVYRLNQRRFKFACLRSEDDLCWFIEKKKDR